MRVRFVSPYKTMLMHLSKTLYANARMKISGILIKTICPSISVKNFSGWYLRLQVRNLNLFLQKIETNIACYLTKIK